MDFIGISINGGRVSASDRFSESNHCEKIIDNIRKLLNIYDNESSSIVDEDLKRNNCKRNEYKLDFENGAIDYRKINNKEIDILLDIKFG